MSSFEHQLKKLIAERCWTQKEAAKKLKVSQANISRWLSGGHEPSFAKASQIAAALGVPLDQLTGSTKGNTTAYRVQESRAPYGSNDSAGTKAMNGLRMRYRKATTRERETIRLALIVLFPVDWDAVVAWFDEK